MTFGTTLVTYRNTAEARPAILKGDMEDAQHVCKLQTLSYIAHVIAACRSSPIHLFTRNKKP